MAQERLCGQCGGSMAGKRSHAVFCSALCRVESSRGLSRAESSERRHPSSAVRRCRVCATDISERGRKAIYCGRFCGERAAGFHLLGPSVLRRCALPECGVEFESFRGRTRCCSEIHVKRLWNRESRADGRQRPTPWNDARRDAYHRRRALKSGSSVGPRFANADVFERDGWVCGLCDEPVPPEAVYPDPLSASLDHVVPLSLGGAHSLENVQLSHLRCNVRKGAREDFVVSA